MGVIFFNTEGGKKGKDSRTLIVQSANLIDFILEVISYSGSGKIIYPLINMNKEVVLDLPPNCTLIEIPEKYNGTIVERLRLVFKYPTILIRERKKIKNASYCISIGYDFFGTVAAIVRVSLLKQKHSYIIRGNRPKTVATSSRSPFNKSFALFRIKIYEKIMRKMLVRGQADIWFQGQEKYEEFHKFIPQNAHSRLHLLNAVLRNLPKNLNTQKKIDLLFLGHINIEKGIIDLLHALGKLRQQGIYPSLRLVGSGPDEEKAKKLIEKLNLSTQVTLAGFASTISEVAQEIASAKLFVLPSHTEGLPRSMIESMAIGTPVLVSSVGGIPFVISNHINGYLVKPNNPNYLANKIKEVLEIISDKDITARVTQNAKATAQSFSFEKRAKIFLEQSIGAGN